MPQDMLRFLGGFVHIHEIVENKNVFFSFFSVYTCATLEASYICSRCIAKSLMHVMK